MSNDVSPGLPGIRLGVVQAYDRARGLGVVIEEGGAPYAFHATAIADGSRMIEVDTEVTFLVVPGHQGRYEARSLTPVADVDTVTVTVTGD
jgi:cold shock CspA family protein